MKWPQKQTPHVMEASKIETVRQRPTYYIMQQPRLLNGFYPEQQGASDTGPNVHHSPHQALLGGAMAEHIELHITILCKLSMQA